MKATGIKLTFESKKGSIATFHDVFEDKVETIVKKHNIIKRFGNFKITEAYLEFENNGNYFKLYLDVNKNKLNDLFKF